VEPRRSIGASHVGFPRYFRIGAFSINSYKALLIVGLYVGSLVSAAVAERSGMSPLRVGLAAMICALAGLIGARVYHILVNMSVYRAERSWRVLWDSSRGGWSVFGALITFVPCVFVAATLLHLSVAGFADCMSAGVLAGGVWIRLGCVFNGCCGGRETSSRFGVRLHDIDGERKRRIPVQFIEMAWWLLGGVVFAMVWPLRLAEGSYAIGVLGWYGVGRFFLEPLREQSDRIFGRIRIDQLVAALLALVAGASLVMRMWR
jgi:phosphatidylglycerol---prolipoprotein diacylglyceryl transferase